MVPTRCGDHGPNGDLSILASRPLPVIAMAEPPATTVSLTSAVAVGGSWAVCCRTVGVAGHAGRVTEQQQEYIRARPHPALAGLVLDYSAYREHSPQPLRRRQAPTGTCTLILSLDPVLRLHGPAGPVVRSSFLAGIHDRAVVTEYTGAQAGLQVDLTPLGAHVLLGRPLPELTNRVPGLDELGDGALATLPGRLGEDPSWSERFDRVDEVLLRMRQASRTRPDPEVAWVWRQLVRTHGGRGVGELAGAVGWSRRRLLTRFEAQVGLAPKAAARVLRFRRAADLLTAPGGGPTIADVAATAGYADHSHLVREFGSLAGCTPSQYMAEWADLDDPFVQDQAATAALPSMS